MKEPKPGRYKHYKGGTYKVLYVATHSETLEKFVVYEAECECRTYGKGSIWVRPLKMFTEKVIVDGKSVPRYRYVG
jgi:cyclomaltodextrinase / maltogenic alpha-amylase / neopullulanase